MTRPPLMENEEDPVRLWAEIWYLRAEVAGPAEFATWQDAAITERTALRKVTAERNALRLELDNSRTKHRICIVERDILLSALKLANYEYGGLEKERDALRAELAAARINKPGRDFP